MARLGAAVLMALLAGCTAGGRGEQTGWRLDNLDTIGGHRVKVAGEPRVIDTPGGKALEFDGVDDAVFLDVHPLAGWPVFTAEVIFKPYPGGPREQRFLHMQVSGSKDRVLFETRLTRDNQWFLDTFIQSGGRAYTLFARTHKHPVGPWYHAAIVVDGKTFKHYVNGELESVRTVAFEPQEPGRTSVGVRINRVSWFKGAVRKARFTPRPLTPGEFLKP
jgi:hypothetical protein